VATIDLTTTARVKELLDVDDSETGSDAAIGRLVTSVSARIERYLRRGVEAAARTETFDVMHGRTTYALHAYPVSAVASVKIATSYNFAAAGAKTSNTDYHVDLAAGIVEQLTTWLTGPRVLQVVYTGGLAADTATVLSNYPDLADAAEKQCVEEWLRRTSLSRTNSNASGVTEARDVVTLLPIVREILAPYRRPVW